MIEQTIARFVILHVDDEPAEACLMREAMRNNHALSDLYNVADGEEAFKFLDRQGEQHKDAPKPDLILLDMNMPRMSGLEFLVEIKKRQAFSSIPVVMITTSDVERDVVASYQLGAAGFIVKPVGLVQFFAAVRMLQDYWCTLVRVPMKTAQLY